MSDIPKRTSTEPTLVIPREALRPIARVVDRNAPTLVPCPGCDGAGMVHIERRAFILERLAEPVDPIAIVEVDEP